MIALSSLPLPLKGKSMVTATLLHMQGSKKVPSSCLGQVLYSFSAKQVTFHSHLPRVVQYTWSVTGHQTGDVLWQIVMTHHRLPGRDMWVIVPHPPHLYECLWYHYFRTRNIITTSFACLFVLFAGRCDLSQTVIPGDLLGIGCIGHCLHLPNGQGIREVPAN